MENKNTMVLVGVIVVGVLAAGSLYYAFGNSIGTLTQEEPTPSEEVNEDTELNGEGDAAPGETMDSGSASSGSGASSGENPSGGTDIRTPSITTNEYTVYHGFTADFEGAGEPLAEEIGEVVVGYEWEAMFPSPLFATVSLPEWDMSAGAKYSVEVWNEDTSEYDTLGKFPSDEEITFPREGFLGARKFKVTGIDPDLRICPGDRSFNWDVRFTFEGEMGLIRTPITQALPSGETCELR